VGGGVELTLRGVTLSIESEELAGKDTGVWKGRGGRSPRFRAHYRVTGRGKKGGSVVEQRPSRKVSVQGAKRKDKRGMDRTRYNELVS